MYTVQTESIVTRMKEVPFGMYHVPNFVMYCIFIVPQSHILGIMNELSTRLGNVCKDVG